MMPERIEPPDDELEQLRSLGPVALPEKTLVTPSLITPSSTAAVGSNGATLQYKFASDVSIEPPRWEWEGWLVYKAVQLLIGRQGAGKTTWASHVVACATTGEPYPGVNHGHSPIKVAFLSHEDPEGRVAARLTAAGADLSMVTILGLVTETKEDGSVNRQWMMPRDIGPLEKHIIELGIKLVVIDGIGYSIASDGEPGYTAVSQALSELGKMAERTDSMVWGLTHPSKGSNDPVTAAIGSTAWTAQSRICSVLGRDKDDENLRVVRVSKSNFKEPETAYVFEIDDHPETESGRVVRVEPSDIEAGEIMASVQAEADHGARAEAKEFLRGELAGGIERPANELIKTAEQLGISKTTLKRARTDLGVNARKAGMDLGWVWSLDESVDGGGTSGGLETASAEGDHGVPLDGARGSSAVGGFLRSEQGLCPAVDEQDHEGGHIGIRGLLRENDTLSLSGLEGSTGAGVVEL